MLDIGWSELLVLAIVAIVVVGPKDLPKLMRTVGFYFGKARRLASDFRRQFDEVVAESEADEVRKNLEAIKANMSRAADLNQPIVKPLMTGPSAKPEHNFAAPPQATVEEPPLPEPANAARAEPTAKQKGTPGKKTAESKNIAAKATPEKKRATTKDEPRVVKPSKKAAEDGEPKS